MHFYIYIRAYVCVYACIYVCTYVPMYLCMNVCLCVCMRVFMYDRSRTPRVLEGLNIGDTTWQHDLLELDSPGVYTCIYMYIYLHIHTCIFMRICVYTYMQKHTYISVIDTYIYIYS